MKVGMVCQLCMMALFLLFLTGCPPIAATQIKAQYVLPKTGKVLVFVDERPGYGVPLDVPPILAMDLTTHLYRQKAAEAENLVNPEKVTVLRQNAKVRPDGKTFEELDVMTVARETGADYVLFVDLFRFDVQSSSDGMLTGGAAQALVRVVDRDGRRLWPAGEVMPSSVDTLVQPAMTEDRDELAVRKRLIEDLTVKIGRLFHDYASDNKYLAR
jgi:hypothetical protein